jgi:UPF0755 protein
MKEFALIPSRWGFEFYTKLTRIEGAFQPGEFTLRTGMNYAAIVAALTTIASDEVTITFPEGLTIEQMAERIDSAFGTGWGDEWLTTLDDNQWAETYSFLIEDSLEGYLFPDTYLVPKDITATQLLTLLMNTFEQKTDDLKSELEQSGKSLDEVVIMASLVQREAKTQRDMHHVAGILWNRVELGMSLDVDATLQYISTRDAKDGEWWPQPDVAAKQLTSQYNTYKYAGLPPGPIANPGLQAITAALNPLETNDLFYLHDRQGVMRFAPNLAEHNNNINQYLR